MIKARLEDITINITDGKHGDCKPEDNSGFYFVSCKDVNNGQIDYAHSRQITEEDFIETHKRTRLEPNDILITNSGTIGRMALVKDIPETYHTTFQKSVAIVKPDTESILPEYLYYKLQNCVSEFINSSNGSAQKNLLLGTLRNFEVDYPESKEKQRKVADLLKAYDDLIESNQKQIKLLEEAAQRLYKEWFVDLHFPGYENVRIIDGVPAGWSKKTISDVCDSIGGGTPSTSRKEYYEGGNIKWVTPTDLTKDGSLVLLDTEKKITESGLKNSSAKLLPPKTILMTSRASIGYFALCDDEVCTNQGFISCVPYQENMRYYLLFNLINRVEEIKGKATGSTFLEIAKRTFRDLEIVIPDNRTLDTFSKIINPVMEKMKISKKEMLRTLEARDRMLPKLMSGEIEM